MNEEAPGINGKGGEGGTNHRQQSEDLLFAQPEWFRVTLASIGDAVITTDTEGLITFLNPIAESLTGWTHDEAVGIPLESVFKIINQGTRKTVESPSVRALRDGVIVGLANHTLLIAKDGTECPIDDSAAPIRNVSGAVAGVVLVFRDITERYHHEQALQSALSFADSVIATLREPFVVLDETLRVRKANTAFYRNFHVSHEETEGRFIYEVGNGQWNIPRLRTLLEEILPQNHTFHDFEVNHEFPEIGTRTMLLDARRFDAVNNQPGLILLAIEDATERKKAEIALQDSEVRYRRLFQSAKDGILILDAVTLKIIDANNFMSELLGYSFEEFLGKELWEIGFFGDKEASKAVYEELKQNGYIRYDHLPLETKTGERAEVEFISNIYNEDHHAVAQCNVRDISERSRMERKLQEQTEALADLHRRKDEFLAMLSHELRNPLAPISNAVHLLRLQRDEDPLQKQARGIIERQVTQMIRLVDDLMEVSRLTTGRVQLRCDLIVVSGVVERGVEAARPILDERKHELRVTVSPQPIWLYADAARLEQVIVNLLTNAAKYTDEGGQIWLTVGQEGDECVLRLRDTGVGIAPDLLPRIFDLFTQAERSLDRSRGGLGIGLALVQRLVEMHGGRVEVHSSLGHGSEFIVRLPVIDPTTPKVALTSMEMVKQVTCPLRVLVVDDNLDTAESLAMVVQALGHDARTAYDGPATLKVALEYLPNVVLLDIGLPGLNGYEVAARIRQEATLNGTVMVATTGYGQASDRQRSHDAGFDHHLVKPADFEILKKILVDVSDGIKE